VRAQLADGRAAGVQILLEAADQHRFALGVDLERGDPAIALAELGCERRCAAAFVGKLRFESAARS